MKIFMLYIFPWLISILGIIAIGLTFALIYLLVEAFGGDASAIKSLGFWVCGIIYFVTVLATHFVLRINPRLWS